MSIRRAEIKDIGRINDLLFQVLDVHHAGRPDLFKGNVKKYTDSELREIVCDDGRPIFVYTDEKDEVIGYAFCALIQHKNDNILTDIKTLYVDDLCVDEKQRGKHIGTSLCDHVVNYAKEQNCHNVTLNVWACNEGAMRFYEKCGLKPYKTGMEILLK